MRSTTNYSNVVFLALGVLLAALVACAPSAAPSGEIKIAMQEYRFVPDTIRVKAGQEIRLTLMNEGKKDHELMVGRQVMMEGKAPSGYMTDLFEGIMVRAEREGKPVDLKELQEEGEPGFMVVLATGAKPVTLIFTIPANKAGEWKIGCFEDDGVHYQEGMKGKFIVER